MENTQNSNQMENEMQKLAFKRVERYFWGKGETLVLVLADNSGISVHKNFLKARLGLAWTPKQKKSA